MLSREVAAQLSNEANIVRRLVVEIASQRHGAHIGGSLSSVDILCFLHFQYLRIQPDIAESEARDYFILSKGHCSAALYAILARKGFIDPSELQSYAHNGSRLGGHPSAALPGVEFSTGSLGHGLSLGVGVALGLRRREHSNRVCVLLGDGELQEGSVWEAASSAARFKLDNLIAIVDQNDLQINGRPDQWLPGETSEMRWRSFGWLVHQCNGHDFDSIAAAFQAARQSSVPTVVIARTIKGKGVSFLENQKKSHHVTLNPLLRARALHDLKGARQ